VAKEIVKKDNQLINAAYTLTLSEQRLILLAVVQGAGEPDTLREMSVHALDYAERFNLTPRAAYAALSDATTQLFERRFSYDQINKRGNLEHVVSRWVSKVTYVEGEGIVRLSFAAVVMPVLCGLQSRFTWCGLEHVASLTSAHAIRLYELLIAWRSTGKTPVIQLEDFRRRLGIEPDEYRKMNDFKKRVLDSALSQINTHTDIIASYTQHKKGRSIVGFEFSFSMKQAARDPNTVDLLTGHTDAEIDKPKRQTITRQQAESMARVGESYEDLYRRLGREYIIKAA